MRFRGPVGVILAAGAVGVIAPPAHAAFPGKNGRIAFASPTTFRSWDVFSMESDGSDRVDLTPDNRGLDLTPTWSPDGGRLAFTASAISGDPFDIWTMSKDGSTKTNLTSTSPVSDIQGSWSPDGSRIVFSSDRDGTTTGFLSDFELWVMDSDGGSPRALTENAAADVQQLEPVWSPDGSRIAFEEGKPGEREIKVLDVATGRQTRLTDSAGDDQSPNWSPDGSKLAFASDRDGDFEIYVMNADGSDVRKHTDNAVQDTDPAWSPDGSSIAIERAPGGYPDIHVTRADGSGAVNVTNTPVLEEVQPDWQPLPGPKRSDYKNAAKFCKAEREFWGDSEFSRRYGNYGNCVSANH